MMQHPAKLPVFNIPSGSGFAAALARRLLEETQGNPAALSQIHILLPTRRAARTVREAFLRESNGAALLLPRLQPLGDVDEEELTFALMGSAADHLDIPPAITSAERDLILAKLIALIPGMAGSFGMALGLASALGRFLDQAHIEELDLNNLDKLAPENLAEHWQITLKFFEILREEWPKILRTRGLIDAAERRSILMHSLARHWQKNPPAHRIIAAGTTGSIPATAQILKIIAQLPNGQIILPGLDREMDEESWDHLGPAHPQYGLKALLEILGVHRKDVNTWPGSCGDDNRLLLAREIMRPPETTAQWSALPDDKSAHASIESALHGISVIEADTQQEEANVIALYLRETLEDPSRTAALITPDRQLAKRVIAQCQRWNIAIDDSAGIALDLTPAGEFFLLCLSAWQHDFSPVALLSCLKHPFCRAGIADERYFAGLNALEETILRGLKPAPGFSGIRARLAESKKAPEILAGFIDDLEKAFAPLIDFSAGDDLSPLLLMRAHLHAYESLCARPGMPSADLPCWRGDAGNALSNLLATLLDYSEEFPPAITPDDYSEALQHFMKAQIVRPAYGAHPRLSILGQMEARLVEADLLILGGLNEGSWPPDPGHDPWMSRAMRKEFGLPDADRAIGLAAHDFIQGFCAKRVVLTRAKINDKSPSVPARWLERLYTVLEATSLAKTLDKGTEQILRAKIMDKADSITPCERPAPCPPVAVRPNALSVTQIETWLKDPYAIYARHILKLEKWQRLERPVEPRDTGTIIHEVMEQFGKLYPRTLPVNTPQVLMELAENILKNYPDDQALWTYWRLRFARIAAWISEQEGEWRSQSSILSLESKGTWTADIAGTPFALSGKPDRIDLIQASGECAILDYKTGGDFSLKGIKAGQYPQLPLEGVMLKNNAFADIGIRGKNTSMLSYWILKGGRKAGMVKNFGHDGKADIPAIIDQAEESFMTLVADFRNPQTPYVCLPDPANMPRFNEYEHLSRHKEWGAAGDDEDENEGGDIE